MLARSRMWILSLAVSGFAVPTVSGQEPQRQQQTVTKYVLFQKYDDGIPLMVSAYDTEAEGLRAVEWYKQQDATSGGRSQYILKERQVPVSSQPPLNKRSTDFATDSTSAPQKPLVVQLQPPSAPTAVASPDENLPSAIYMVLEKEKQMFGLMKPGYTGGSYWATDIENARRKEREYYQKNGVLPSLLKIDKPSAIRYHVEKAKRDGTYRNLDPKAAPEPAPTTIRTVPAYNPPQEFISTPPQPQQQPVVVTERIVYTGQQPTGPSPYELMLMQQQAQQMQMQAQMLMQQQAAHSAMLRAQSAAATQQVFQNSMQQMRNLNPLMVAPTPTYGYGTAATPTVVSNPYLK